MIECTLQEAVGRCEKDGGRFYTKSQGNNQRIFSREDNSPLIIDQEGNPFELETTDFKEAWIYEHPATKSAFGKWESEQLRFGVVDETLKARKEGWNAALNAVLNLPPHNSFCDRSTEKIIDLIEE